tara:strand:- start:7151 stop:8212 length:1062 start_codon:yes stop_codon:yes gene_type:complete
MKENGSHLLEVNRLKMYFPVKGGVLLRSVANCKAVDGVSLFVDEGETLGLVGESGCGKSTLGKCIVNLLEPTEGEVVFEGQRLNRETLQSPSPLLKPATQAKEFVEAYQHRREILPLRRDLQMIFQDPAESLNSRMNVGSILEEPFLIHKIGDAKERKARIIDLLQKVGLNESAINRFPFQFSGGQRQRIGIARSIALNPKLIVCDEPVSALDVSVQSQVLNLMMDLQRELSLSYLFIAHDLAVVRHISDRVAVMYLGKIVEMAGADEIYENPQHAYTKALIKAIPVPDPTVRRQHVPLEGDVPSPINPPQGCAFGHRVNHPKWKDSIGMDLELKEVGDRHWVQPCPCCTDAA